MTTEAVSITEDVFGQTSEGKDVKRFTFKNKRDVEVEVLSLGCSIHRIKVPNNKGEFSDVVTGFEHAAEYETNVPSFGAVVGRFANRIKNGQFTLDGTSYQLAINNGPNHLHGGIVRFSMKNWDTQIEEGKVHFSLTSPDGEENYPGEVKVKVTYELTNDNELVIDYTATTNKPTIINLTNHTYFNLGGHQSGTVYDHTIAIYADKYTPKDETGIPTGEIASVDGTKFDLRQPVVLGGRVLNIPGPKPGYDHNFCLDQDPNVPRKLVARVGHEKSGRVMDVYTDQPGVQFYTGNFLDGSLARCKDGAVYKQHAALCLETQNYPDAINKPNFPSCVLRPGETYRHVCAYKFYIATK